MKGVLPVSKRRDEVKAAVYSVVNDVSTVQAALVVQVSLKLIINILDDRLKAVEQNKAEIRERAGRKYSDIKACDCIKHASDTHLRWIKP